MSTNLGTILVGLGYDLSALEKGAPEAFRLISSQTMGMSAEMKRASREGAESFRLIDEALGIHLSRPLTRILTQEFPSLAKGLQSVLGVGVVGALGVAGVELFDKMGAAIGKAQKAQEELRSATLNVDNVFAQEMASYKEKDKAVTAATEKVNKLIEAEEKQTKAALDASGPWEHFLAAVGDFGNKLFSFQSTLNIQQISKQLGEFKQQFAGLALTDSIKGTHEAMKLLTDEIATATKKYEEMTALAKQGQTLSYPTLARFGTQDIAPKPHIPTAEELASQKVYLDNLQKDKELWDEITKDVQGQEAQAAALERQKEAAAAVADLYRSMGESLKKLAPETDPLKKLGDEIHLMKYKAEQDFAELGKTSDSALQMRAAMAALNSYESRLDGIYAKAMADAGVLKAQSELPTTISATGTAPLFKAPSTFPAFGAGGTAGAQFDVFKSDAAAQVKLMAEAYEDAVSPAQKFELVQKELDLILKNADGSFKDAKNGAAAYSSPRCRRRQRQ